MPGLPPFSSKRPAAVDRGVRPRDPRCVDALTSVLSTLSLRSSVFARAELRAPWAVHTRGLEGGIFHAVVRGRAVLRLDRDRESVALAEGDVAVVPHGEGHVMCDAPSTRPVPIAGRTRPAPDGGAALLSIDGGGAECRLVCGRFEIDRHATHPLVSLLPPLIHLRRDDPVLGPWLAPTLALMASELTAGAPGAGVVLTRLADVLVVHALRAHVASDAPAPVGWLRALRDPQVGKALGLVHARPGETWTAASLAARVGVSRSVLYERFTELVGEPPARYLLRWRMHVAEKSLSDDASLGLGEVAARVGYGTEAAFAKAFKRFTGEAPGAWRRRASAGGLLTPR